MTAESLKSPADDPRVRRLRQSAVTLTNPLYKHPGAVLAKHLPRANVSVLQICVTAGVHRPQLYRILQSRAPITTAVANALEHHRLGKATKWLAAQRAYDDNNKHATKYQRAADNLERKLRHADELIREANQLAVELYDHN